MDWAVCEREQTGFKRREGIAVEECEALMNHVSC